MESELIQFSAAAAFPPAGCRMPPLSTAAASSINELFIKNKFLEGKTDITALRLFLFLLHHNYRFMLFISYKYYFSPKVESIY